MRSKVLAAVVVVVLAGIAEAASVEDYFNDAQERLQANEPKAAIIQLKNGLQEDPTHLPSRQLLGEIYLQQGDGPSAEKELRRAQALGGEARYWEQPLAEALLLQGKHKELLEQIPVDRSRPTEDQASVLVLRGRALLADGQREWARQAFAAAAELAPASPAPLIGMARLHLAEGKIDAATEALDKTLAQHPDNVDALSLKGQLALGRRESDEALGFFERALELDARYPEALMGRAVLLAQSGKLDEATRDLDALSAVREGIVPALYVRAMIAFRQGDLDLAQAGVDAVLKALPGHAESLVLRGVVSLMRGEDEIARQYLEKAMTFGAKSAEVDKLVAALYISAREYDRVVELLGGQLMSTDDVQLLALLGSAYMGQGRQELAFRAYGRAIELAPDVSQLRTHLGISLIRAGESQQGMEMLQSAVEVSRDALNPEMILVMGHLSRGDRDAARDAALAMERRNPQNVQVLNLAGIVLLANEDLEGAQALFERALEAAPGFAPTRINLARAALARNDRSQAKMQFEKILATQPSYLDAMIGMLALADSAGNTAELEQWVNRATQAHPNAIQPRVVLLDHYLRRQMVPPALQLAGDLARAYPDNATVIHLLGQANLQAGRYDDAAHHFGTVTQMDPRHVTAWVRLALSSSLQGDRGGEERALHQALALEPDHLEANSRLAALRIAEGRLDEALQIANRMTEKHPEKAEGYRLTGVAHHRAGRIDEAQTALKRSMGIEPSSQVARLIADIQARSGDGQGAVRTLQEWLQRAPDDHQARQQLADLLIGQGQKGLAEKEYLAIVARRPQDFVTLNNLAWLQHEIDSPAAVDSARRAYELAPKNAAVVDTYGWMLFKHGGSVEEALRLLQQAMLFNPRNPEIQLHNATVLAAVDRKTEAVTILRRLVRQSPKFPQVDEARSLLGRLGG